jgi:integrase
MKNPSGFGGVDKLPGKRRRPYRARKTIGYDQNKRQKRVTLGYFRTNREAVQALIKEQDLGISTNKNFTIENIYEMWKKQNFVNFAKNTIVLYETAFKNLHRIHQVKLRQLKMLDLQNIFNQMPLSESSKRPVKSLLKSLYKLAMTYDFIDKDYSALIQLGKITPVISRKIFSPGELRILWKNEQDLIISTVLIMIYTGMRIGEILTLKRENINLRQRYLRCGIKTKAGKNRIIPVHQKIVPILERLMNISFHKKLLIEMSYSNYRVRFLTILKKIGISPHTTHDCRHTFASLLSSAEANQTAIKLMVGHSSFETTEKIYVHKTLKDLRKVVDKIKG